MALIPIFVSSTFRDFHRERDELIAAVLPMLNDRAVEFGCRVEIAGLRWGVTVEDADADARQNRVLQVCLSEIDRTRPLFVGLLGDRFGWVPEPHRLRLAVQEARITDYDPDWSVTALEFEYGALRRPDSVAVFFERDVVGQPPPQWRDLDPSRARALRRRVRERCEVHTYQVDTEGSNAFDLSAFVAVTARVLGDKVADRARELGRAHADPVAAADALFFDDRASAFAGRDELVARVAGELTHGSSVCLLGASGIGKSAIWCAAITRLRQAGHRVVAVPVGAAPEVSTARAVIARLVTLLGGEVTPTMTVDELAEVLRTRCAAEVPLVLAVDGIDALPDSARPVFLGGLPPDVMVLASTTDPTQADYLAALGARIEQVSEIGPDEARDVVAGICATMGRSLPTAAVDSLATRPRSPLWLRLAVGELSALDADDFAGVNPAADPLAELAALVIRVVQRLPTDVGDLVAMIVDRAARRFGPVPVQRTLALVAISRSGLRTVDLEALVGVDTLTIAGIRRALPGVLIARGAGGRLGLAHLVVRDWVLRELVPTANMRALHHEIGWQLAQFAATDEICDQDALWHLLRAGDPAAAGRIDRAGNNHHRAGLAAVVLDSLRVDGFRDALAGVGASGIYFLAGIALEYKPTLGAVERYEFCQWVFDTARSRFERDDAGEAELQAVCGAATGIADLSAVEGKEAEERAAAVSAREFGERLVTRFPDSDLAREVRAHTSLWHSSVMRPTSPEIALASARQSVEDWQHLESRTPGQRVDAWLQFALGQYAELLGRTEDKDSARHVRARALSIAERAAGQAAGQERMGQVNVIHHLIHLADDASDQRYTSEAVELGGRAVSLAESDYAADPNRQATEALALACRINGFVLAYAGDLQGGSDQLTRSETLFGAAARSDSGNAVAAAFAMGTSAVAAAVNLALGDRSLAAEQLAAAKALNVSDESGVWYQVFDAAARFHARASDDRRWVVAATTAANEYARVDATATKPREWLATQFANRASHERTDVADSLWETACGHAKALFAIDPSNEGHLATLLGVHDAYGVWLAKRRRVSEAAHVWIGQATAAGVATEHAGVRGNRASIAKNLRRLAAELADLNKRSPLAITCRERADWLDKWDERI
ncbi:DUF4062 domain-containing protein [Nocardia fluminea]|uniref:DUF4062 domain-containing protein n=1 Tax=Nocardia fluminea TaxID=134984 RepID=UPI003673348B